MRRPVFALALCVVFVSLLATAAAAAATGGWTHLGNGGAPGTASLNGAVSALNTDKPGVLYVGGAFTDAGGKPAADHIASWNGAAWSAVGPDLNGAVHAIAYHAGKVYAGGKFTNAGGHADADFLAVWDGSHWAPFCNSTGPDPSFGGSVSALQIIGSTLYVGGAFQNGADIDSADYLLACDLNTGAASSTVPNDGDINGGVYALTADSNGTLYAGGQFINLATIPAADHVASYGGGVWHAMGSGPSVGGGAVDGYVRSITAHGTDVYVGTDATDVAGIAQADHVARWNGSAWSAIGSNTAGSNGWFPASSFIYAMTTYGSLVFATGSFQNANGDPRADFIAYFDGTRLAPDRLGRRRQRPVARKRHRDRGLPQAAVRRGELHERRRRHGRGVRRLLLDPAARRADRHERRRPVHREQRLQRHPAPASRRRSRWPGAHSGTVFVSIQNDGLLDDTFTVKGTGAAQGFTVNYFRGSHQRDGAGASRNLLDRKPGAGRRARRSGWS